MIPQPISIIRSMGGLVFDAVFEENHESDLEVTDNPVETGVVVSDHAYMLPLRVTISAGVSDVLLSGSTTGDQFASDAGRSRKAFQLLTELQSKAEPFDVQTGLKLYKNMVCKSVRSGQDKDTSGVFVFQAELREVNIVYTKSITYTRAKPGKTRRQASPTKNRGEQQAKEVTNPKTKMSLAEEGLRLAGYSGKALAEKLAEYAKKIGFGR